jgi:Ca-activated chloride channel family protein
LSLNVDVDLGVSYVSTSGGRIPFIIRVKSGETARFRAPLSLAIAIDVSESMRGRKLEMAKEAAKRVVNCLGEKDILSLYAFSGHVEPIAENVYVTSKEWFKYHIDMLKIHAFTNLFEALNRSWRAVLKSPQNYVRRVLLLTDGQPTVGERSIEAFSRESGEAFSNGVSIVCYGIGEDYNENILYTIARSSNGMFRHVDDPSQIVEHFVYDVSQMLSTVANNTILRIIPVQGVKIAIYGRNYSVVESIAEVPIGGVEANTAIEIYGELFTPPRIEGVYRLASIELVYDDVSSNTQKIISNIAEIKATYTANSELLSKGVNKAVIDKVLALIKTEEISQAIARGDTKTLTAKLEEIGRTVVLDPAKTRMLKDILDEYSKTRKLDTKEALYLTMALQQGKTQILQRRKDSST